MPSAQQHLDQVEQCEQLAAAARNGFPGWAITALFYGALHLAETYFYLDPDPAEPDGYISHSERDPAIARRLPEIRLQYAQLRIASEGARYRCIRYLPADVDSARSMWYEPLKAAMQTRINDIGTM